jgi:hypothetical protein
MGSLVEVISPHERVATALIPFLAALVLRLIVGKNQLTRAVLSLATMWFALNVLLAPYSVNMRREIIHLSSRLK